MREIPEKMFVWAVKIMNACTDAKHKISLMRYFSRYSQPETKERSFVEIYFHEMITYVKGHFSKAPYRCIKMSHAYRKHEQIYE